ncbi:hypothetical protein HPB50_020362 [Hyalomma asiaticum]|uniref:Uncharacterized protein n=1 Tax=Hyalomma asiaticum TaxID=266040 RepID=A0ACB7SPJ6_HYAAI|nr:hypothetical protein HPB50_020362 [Hyalomma asiaticum]
MFWFRLPRVATPPSPSVLRLVVAPSRNHAGTLTLIVYGAAVAEDTTFGADRSVRPSFFHTRPPASLGDRCRFVEATLGVAEPTGTASVCTSRLDRPRGSRTYVLQRGRAVRCGRCLRSTRSKSRASRVRAVLALPLPLFPGHDISRLQWEQTQLPHSAADRPHHHQPTNVFSPDRLFSLQPKRVRTAMQN